MVRREILRRVGVPSFTSHLKQTQVSFIENKMNVTKPKSDGRVKKYCPILIPAGLHRRLKEKARDKKLRLNQYIPRLLLKTLRIKDDSN
jgi:hypothetical protein